MLARLRLLSSWGRVLGVFVVSLGIGFMLVASALHLYNRHTAGYIEAAANACTEASPQSKQIECWYSIMRHEFDRGGTDRALRAFAHIYSTYPAFAESGCHRHAHAVGDMSYYFDYLNHRDLSRMEFPPSANACGYGFYHGFFEHLVQEHPDPAFVTETCEFLATRLKDTAPAIRQICYHGSGHGFTLARADALISPEEWTIENFTSDANVQCESLPQATPYEISECRQGVYNVLVDWMSDGEYGLTYDYERPFAFCDQETGDRQRDCYYEVAQKLDAVTGRDAARAGAIVASLPREDLRALTLTTGIAGMVQHAPSGDQLNLLAGCRLVDDSLRAACLTGIVGGLVEHGTPGAEYRGAARFCQMDELTSDERGQCYDTLRIQLSRYHTATGVSALCSDGALPAGLCGTIQP